MDLIETTPMMLAGETARLLRIADLLDKAREDAELRHAARRDGLALGPVTGMRKLDNTLGGGLRPGLHIAHGQPGVGKSALCLQIATSCGAPALYVSCEMPSLALLKRLAARLTETYLRRFDTGEFDSQAALDLYRQAAAGASGLAILDATVGQADLATMFGAAEATRKLTPDNPHLLIVVDSIHTWADSLNPAVEEYERLNGALTGLQQLAARLSCPILGIAERNRMSMKSGGQSASAGSRRFEFCSESVIELSFREDKKPIPDAHGNVDVRLIVSKNRNGVPYWEGNLRFCGPLQRYEEV